MPLDSKAPHGNGRFQQVGTRPVRPDGVDKVTGRAKYGRDVYFPNTLFATFVRCPYGAAKLLSVDEAAALAVPGVVEVEITGDAGRYHGQPVGHLLAESRLAMKRGLRALDPKWQLQPLSTKLARKRQ